MFMPLFIDGRNEFIIYFVTNFEVINIMQNLNFLLAHENKPSRSSWYLRNVTRYTRNTFLFLTIFRCSLFSDVIFIDIQLQLETFKKATKSCKALIFTRYSLYFIK